jgi:uncharacterized membrane protein
MSDASAEGRRRWNVWLIASLCLNLFLIGVIVMGLIVARNRAALMAAGGGGMRPEIVIQLLPQSGALKMCAAVEQRTPAFRRLGQNLVEARNAMFKLFRAEPFDQSAFRQSLSRITAAEGAVAAEREALVADLVAQLTPQERAHFANEATRRFLTPGRQKLPPRDRGALAEICRGLRSGMPK